MTERRGYAPITPFLVEEEFQAWSQTQHASEEQLSYILSLMTSYCRSKYGRDPEHFGILFRAFEGEEKHFAPLYSALEDGSPLSWTAVNDLVTYLKTIIITKGGKTLRDYEKERRNDPKYVQPGFRPVRDVLQIYESTPEYEIGVQASPYCDPPGMRYIKFYRMMMVDIDTPSGGLGGNPHCIDIDNPSGLEGGSATISTKLEELERTCGFPMRFRLYKTRNGYHVFVVSHMISHRSPASLKIASFMGCDEWYIVYFRYHGYCVRLSPKIGEETIEHTFIGEYGSGENVCGELIEKLEEGFGGTTLSVPPRTSRKGRYAYPVGPQSPVVPLHGGAVGDTDPMEDSSG